MRHGGNLEARPTPNELARRLKINSVCFVPLVLRCVVCVCGTHIVACAASYGEMAVTRRHTHTHAHTCVSLLRFRFSFIKMPKKHAQSVEAEEEAKAQAAAKGHGRQIKALT